MFSSKTGASSYVQTHGEESPSDVEIISRPPEHGRSGRSALLAASLASAEELSLTDPWAQPYESWLDLNRTATNVVLSSPHTTETIQAVNGQTRLSQSTRLLSEFPSSRDWISRCARSRGECNVRDVGLVLRRELSPMRRRSLAAMRRDLLPVRAQIHPLIFPQPQLCCSLCLPSAPSLSLQATSFFPRLRANFLFLSSRHN